MPVDKRNFTDVSQSSGIPHENVVATKEFRRTGRRWTAGRVRWIRPGRRTTSPARGSSDPTRAQGRDRRRRNARNRISHVLLSHCFWHVPVLGRLCRLPNACQLGALSIVPRRWLLWNCCYFELYEEPRCVASASFGLRSIGRSIVADGYSIPRIICAVPGHYPDRGGLKLPWLAFRFCPAAPSTNFWMRYARSAND